MVVFGDCEEGMGALGHVTRRGHSGAQPEAARCFLPADDALCLGLPGRVQLIAPGFDQPWLGTAGPAPARPGPFLHGDVHLMVRGVHGAELRGRRGRIGAAAIRLLAALWLAYGALRVARADLLYP